VTQHKRFIRAATAVAVLAGTVHVAAAAPNAGPAPAAGPETGLTPAGVPSAGVFVVGRSLGAAELGMTRKEIQDVWGRKHGVCRTCARTTWYFNEKPFYPQGVGATFRRGRAVALFTVWQPKGWRTPRGLVLGDPASEVSLVYGTLERRLCSGYSALVRPGRRVQSVFYVKDDELWGFGLTRTGEPPCR
jgi:hypothetical protein